MHVADRIVVDPDVLHGQPVIRGTRIAVSLVLRKLAEGATLPELLDAYPHLSAEDVRAVLAYAADAIDHEGIVFTSPSHDTPAA